MPRTPRLPLWLVRAWVTAPGDFPARDLQEAKVNAADVKDAILRAALTAWPYGLAVTVVSVERINPPSSVND